MITNLLRITNKIIRSILFFTIFLISYIILPSAYLLLSIFRLGGTKVNFKLLRLYVKFMFFMSGIKIEVKGRENIDKNKNSIFISNHQSILDPILLMCALPITFRPTIAEEFFNAPVPLFRYLITKSGFIPMHTGFSGEFKNDINKLAEILNNGETLHIFPEGFATRDGSLLKFKWGAAEAAFNTGKPVIPIAIDGSMKVFPVNTKMEMEVRVGKRKDSKLGLLGAFIRTQLTMLYKFTPGKIKINIGKAVTFEKRKEIDFDELKRASERLQNEVSKLKRS